jgi:nucleoside-diphosphate-sugar epimerase
MDIIIYGHNGWIGTQVKNLLNKDNSKITFYCSQYRVDDTVNIEKELLEVNPSHMLCLVGRTHGMIDDKEYTTIDYLEQPGKLYENVRDNLYSPVFLSLLAKKHNKHFTYLGTGCVFNYDENHPYGLEENGFTEQDKPNFFGSSYSTVKGFTDMLMHQLESNTLNLRIRMPITCDLSARNFITKILNYKKICSIPNSMSVLPDLLPTMLNMMENKELGTYNFTNPGLISHNEILTMYRDIVDHTFKWENFTIEEQNMILDSKRSNNFLDTTKLESKYKVPNIKESVKKILYELNDKLNNNSI